MLQTGLSRCLLVSGLLAIAPLVAEAEGVAGLDGVWMLNLPDSESEIVFTEEGERVSSEYDLLSDDPSLYCTPASVARIWGNPNSRIRIEQLATEIRINYELFDLRRTIPLGDSSVLSDSPSTHNLEGTEFPEMGSSIAHYEGDALIIESHNHVPGYIRTSRGIPQGTATIAYEELRVDNDTLYITHTYIDEELYKKPLVLNYNFSRLDAEDVDIYNCTDANYDWFLELNEDN